MSQVLPAFEDEIGPWPTLVLITTTQFGAVGTHVLLHSPATLTAGASGIAFGLIGFGVAYFHRNRNHEQRKFFLKWFAYGLAFGLLVRANNAAHLGGFLTGLPLGYLIAGSRVRNQWVWRLVGIFCLALWIVCLGFLANNLVVQGRALREEQHNAGRIGTCPISRLALSTLSTAGFEHYS